jgi:hypothetical protein
MRGFFPFGFAQGQNDKQKTEAGSFTALRNDKRKDKSEMRGSLHCGGKVRRLRSG